MGIGNPARGAGLRRPLALLVGLVVFAGCGWLESPFDIKKPPPPEGTRAVDLLPEEGAAGPLDDFPFSRLTLDAARDYAGRRYDNGTTLTVMRFSSVDVAADVTDREYEGPSAWDRDPPVSIRNRRRVQYGNYSWVELRGDGRYCFAWTNHEWFFLVEARSKSAARAVILATGFASEPEEEG